MKKIDWKSFAIGVLLTTTVMFGTGAAISTTDKWDDNQKWDIKLTTPSVAVASGELELPGYEPFHSVVTGLNGRTISVVWRKRIN